MIGTTENQEYSFGETIIRGDIKAQQAQKFDGHMIVGMRSDSHTKQ